MSSRLHRKTTAADASFVRCSRHFVGEILKKQDNDTICSNYSI